MGHLNHTFALKAAHSMFRVGNHPPPGDGASSFEEWPWGFPRNVRLNTCPTPLRGRLSANGSERLRLLGGCFPMSDPKRTVHERFCERCERLANVFVGCLLHGGGHEAGCVFLWSLFLGVFCLCS